MFCKLIRLTKDSELRTTQSGKQVLRVSGAYDAGWGSNKKVQYVDFALWGDRAVSVAGMFLKGTAIVVNVDNLYVDAYKKNNGEAGSNLKGDIVSFQFTGKSEKPAQPSSSMGTQINSQSPAPAAPAGFDSFDDSIPF